MAAGRSSRRVLAAINSLGDDSVVVLPQDHARFEALIGDYFNVDSDEGGSDDDSDCGKIILEVAKVPKYYTTS